MWGSVQRGIWDEPKNGPSETSSTSIPHCPVLGTPESHIECQNKDLSISSLERWSQEAHLEEEEYKTRKGRIQFRVCWWAGYHCGRDKQAPELSHLKGEEFVIFIHQFPCIIGRGLLLTCVDSLMLLTFPLCEPCTLLWVDNALGWTVTRSH